MRSFLLSIGLVILIGAFSVTEGQVRVALQDQEPAPKTQDPAPNAKDPAPNAKGPAPKQNQDPAKSKSSDRPKKQDSGNQEKKKSNNQDSEVAINPQQAAADAALASYLSSPRRRRLGRTPRMFGDWFGPGIRISTISETPGPTNGLFTGIRFPQTVRVGKVSENNSALPYDRVILNYNYFHNAIPAAAIGPYFQTTQGSKSLSRYTMGVERTFLDGLTSIETRFVLNDVPDFGHNPVGSGPLGYQAHSPTIGNLAIIGKVLLFENDSTALAMGMGVEVPTGGDSTIQSGSSLIEIENQSVYLTPYVGLLKKPTDSPWFANAFVQIETPLGGDTVRGIDPATMLPTSTASLTAPTVLFVDVGVGRWLMQRPCGFISGIAGFFEAHYNASLNDLDPVRGLVTSNTLSTNYDLNSDESDFDVVDLSVGLHLEMAQRSKLRLGAVFPISDDRPFESEFGIQFTRTR